MEQNYLLVALVLIGLGALLLVVEILLPTGGFLVVGALLCFAAAVGTILYYGNQIQAAVALVGMAIGLPAAGYVAVLAWRRMSLDTVLETSPAAPVPTATDLELLKGRTGKTVSPLRPSGTVEFDGRRVDATTEGPMLDAGVWVRCVGVKWGQAVVRRIEDPVDLTGIDPDAPPKDAAPPGEEPKGSMPKKDDFDDFDIGLDRA